MLMSDVTPTPPQDDARTDQQLVDAINAGDDRAFEALYLRYRDWVVNLAYRFVRDREIALDTLQETFSYVLRKFPGFELTARFTTFLYPVVKHTALDMRRKNSRQIGVDDAILDSNPSPHAPADPDDPRETLSRVLTGLSDVHREVVLMRFVDDLALQEIADILGVPLGTVKSRLHNALAALRDDPATRRYFQRE